MTAANVGNEPILWKNSVLLSQKLRFEERASAFPIRLCAFAAVQEKS